MKIYALMMTYQQMDWLPYSLDQFDTALKFGSIDKVLISEGAHSKQLPERSLDGSFEYLINRTKDDDRYEIFDNVPFRNSCNRYDKAQASVLNKMCSTFPDDEDVWVFYIHDDEYFFNVFLKNIRNLCMEADEAGKDMIVTKQLAFAFNFHMYWNNRTVYMLFKWHKGTKWAPATTPCYSNGTPYLNKKDKIIFRPGFEYITFHFGHIKKMDRQKMRYVLSAEKGTVGANHWFDEIYSKADLKDLNATYEKNVPIIGYGFKKDSSDMGSAVVQKLNYYKGRYPEAVNNHPYKDIYDIRTV